MTTGQGVQSAPVDIRTTFAQRIYSLIYSVALFNSNFSQHYVDQARLFRLGGDQVLPAPGDDYEIISFTDPTTRIGYGAIVPATGPQDTTMAGQLILRARALAEQVKNGDNNARFQLDQVVEDIGMVMRAVNALGNVPL